MGTATDEPLIADDPVALLSEARERTLAIVGGLEQADLDRVLDPVMSPVAWDLGHIAAFEDLWLVHRSTGLTQLHDDLGETYDAVASPRSERPNLPWLRSDGAFEYLEQVRARALDALAGPTPPSAEIIDLVVRHEHQHAETILQTVQLSRVGWAPDLPSPESPETPQHQAANGALNMLALPGGEFELGADSDGFAYDNERPRHSRTLSPFLIGRTPALNSDWLEFIDADGYSRSELWSNEGLEWLAETDTKHPGGWLPDGSDFLEWRAGEARKLDPLRPVVHICAHEAEAFATFHGARLPTEAEWEFAALHAAESRVTTAHSPNLDTLARGTRRISPASEGPLGMLGDVWEWTSSEFAAYPGFQWHPYREYSEPHLGPEHRVLRGGSWATRTRVATPTFRNWDLPIRRQIFAGVRLASSQ